MSCPGRCSRMARRPGELNPVAGVGVGTGGQKDVFQNLVLRGVVEIRIQNVKKSVESSRGRV